MGDGRNKIKKFQKVLDKYKKLRYTIIEERKKHRLEVKSQSDAEADQAGVIKGTPEPP